MQHSQIGAGEQH